MRDMATRAGRSDEFEIASAATSREEIGMPVYPPARRKLAEHGIGVDGNDLGVSMHQARQMTRGDYEYYDMIICMDHNNIRNAEKIIGGDSEGKISLLLDHASRKGEQVADPWYTGNFDETWRDVTEGCRGLLESI